MGADGGPVDTDGNGIPNVEWPEQPAEEQANVALYGEAWEVNMKALLERALRDVDREREQVNDWHAFGMEQARNHAQIVNRLAQDAATVSARISSNAAIVDNLVNVAAITNPAELAETSIGAKVAADVRDAVTQGIGAAVEQGVVSSPVAQGTTGVAQGAMQTATGIADAAILAQIAKLAEVVSVLAIKVLGEEVTAEKPV